MKDNPRMTSTTKLRRRLIVSLMAFAAIAASCGSSTSDAGDKSASPTTDSSSTETSTEETAEQEGKSAFPVTIAHAFGETVVEEEPLRVVTWGWGSADAAIALDVIPVAIGSQPYGGNEDGVLPWVVEALEAAGAETPTILPDQTEVPFESIAAADPDLILAVYSGISDVDYELLSQIAPTVAYPDQPWATDWRDLIEIVGRSVGKAEEATTLLADIDGRVADAAAAHPELAGRTVALVANTADQFYVYKPADPRVAFTLELGLVSAPSVDELSNGDSTFYFTLSRERLAELTSDILVAYAESDEASAEFLESGPAQAMPQITSNAVAPVIGQSLVASVSPPTALSLTWGLDDYVALLSAAATASDGEGSDVSGETDLDDEQQAAASAWELVFDSNATFADKSGHLADAAALEPTVAAYREAGATMGGIALSPTAVAIDGDQASVTYDVLFGGSAAYTDLVGEMTFVDGVWVVGRDEFCSFMSSARTPCA